MDSSYRIATVPLDVALAAPQELFAEYANECSLPELGQISPQAALYKKMDEAGGMRCFAVYCEQQMVGFATLLIYVLPHYGKKVATTESIFIAEAHRSSGIGTKLLTFLEAYAKQQSCLAMLYTAPTGSRFQKLLASKCRHSNSVYIQSL